MGRSVASPPRATSTLPGRTEKGRCGGGGCREVRLSEESTRVSRGVCTGPTSRAGSPGARCRAVAGPLPWHTPGPLPRRRRATTAPRGEAGKGTRLRARPSWPEQPRLVFQMPFLGQLSRCHVCRPGAGTRARDTIPGPGKRYTLDPMCTCPEVPRGQGPPGPVGWSSASHRPSPADPLRPWARSPASSAASTLSHAPPKGGWSHRPWLQSL